MKKPHRLKVTRPDFLLLLMGGNPDNLRPERMRLCLKDTTALCYSVYTVLMEAEMEPEDILSCNNDGESIGIKFRSKGAAKEVYTRCAEGGTVRYGNHHYTVRLKQRDQFLICTAECDDPDEDDE